MTSFLNFYNHIGQHQPWHWTVTASNGKILCHSEKYVKYTDCARGAQVALRTHGPIQPYHALALDAGDQSARAYIVRRFTIEDD